MMKKFLKIAILPFLSVIMISCAEDASKPDDIPAYTLDSIAGYTYITKFTSSSGNELRPMITVFNDDRVDWNMSSTNMGVNKYYYKAESDGFCPNVWTMYWYSTKGDFIANKTENAAMSIKLGINSLEKITVLVSVANAGAGSSMAGTPLTMTLVSPVKNTVPTEIDSENVDIEDVVIQVLGEAVPWPYEGEKIYSGTFNFLVGENGSVAKTKGSSGESVPSIKISKAEGNTVNITTQKIVYGGMDVMQFEIKGVEVKKSGDIYYFQKGEFISSDGNYEINGKSVTGKLENGILVLRVQFVPGAMPFLLTEVFTSN